MLTDVPGKTAKRYGAVDTLISAWGMLFFLVIFLCDAPWAVEAREEAPISIDAEFPGGNILVDRVEGDIVHVRPELRDTEGWWFYWNFRVSHVAEGRMLTFDFGERSPIGVHGPAVSNDGGATWTWLGAEHGVGSGFAYTFSEGGSAWFAFTIPYLEADLARFVKRWSGNPVLVSEKLCQSASGRTVELLRAGCTGSSPRCRVLITARHHACETMASYVLEGILDAVLREDECGRWFQEHVEVVAIPFMDKDGVEEGDQGKNRRPRDHNRDYEGQSMYPETAALRSLVDVWEPGLLQVVLDLHCPYIRGKGNEVIYLVGSPSAEMWTQQQRFAACLERLNESPLPYRASDNLPFGREWNTPDNYGKGMSCARWAETLAGVGLAASMEIPYANAGGSVVTPESARAFGISIARALRSFIFSDPGIFD